MSNVSYDLDTSGGLMPLIRALIKPPDEDANAQKPKKPQHPYYKRPGKGHNHDSCDACAEGGDLICCDRCPASFHLGCYDPPLDENDIPSGLWLCRECRASDAEKTPSARGSRAQSPADPADRKSRSLRNSRANSVKKKGKDEEEEKPLEKELSPMEVLVKAARIMNPRQFELPREMRLPCLFPGTEKADGGKTGGGSLVCVDAAGCVPLPAHLCFVCQLTCKAAPLLRCDYCPLLYHQDCLDPPLTALPTGRWMCPNHVEQYIDWKLVTSVSATERAALWDRFAGPVDQHAVKVDFIRRARAQKPRFRVKVPADVQGRVCVPAMVRHHYRRPPPLLPARREHARCSAVLKRLRECKDFDYAAEVDTSLPKHKICLNMSCPQYTDEGPCPCDQDSDKADAIKQEEDVDRDGTEERELSQDRETVSDKSIKEEKHSSSSESASASESEEEGAGAGRPRRGRGARGRGRAAVRRVELRGGRALRRLTASAGRGLRRLDRRLVRLLAWQRLQQISWGEMSGAEWGSAVGAGIQAVVRRAVAARRLTACGATPPSAMLSPADRRRIAAAVWGARQRPPALSPTLPTSLSPSPPSPLPPLPAADACVLATFTELTPGNGSGLEGVGGVVAMRRAAVNVGTDSGCVVRLPLCCRRAAPTHAAVFLDQVTRHFELINYSEWGSGVNGVLYTCDATLCDTRRDQSPLLRVRQRQPLRINGDLTKPTGAEIRGRCRCPERPPPPSAAWEGSAILPHGALLTFGCTSFVFSITDCLPLQ